MCVFCMVAAHLCVIEPIEEDAASLATTELFDHPQRPREAVLEVVKTKSVHVRGHKQDPLAAKERERERW